MAAECFGGEGDHLGGVGDLSQDGLLEEEAVADDADEAGGDLVGNVGGDPGGGSFAGDQGGERGADQVGAVAPAGAEPGVGAAAARAITSGA